jgi:putative membrane protein
MFGLAGGDRGALRPKTIIAIVVVSVFLLFVIQNSADVDIRFLFWKLTVSRVLLLSGSLGVGVLIGFLIGWDHFGKRKA